MLTPLKKNTQRLIAVGSGFKTNALRASQSRKLLSWGLNNTITFEISKKNETYFDIKSWLAATDTILGYTKEDVYTTIDKKDLRSFDAFIEYKGPIKAPVKKDEKIASIKIYNKDELLKSIPVYSFENVKKINFLLSLLTSFNYMIWGDV